MSLKAILVTEIYDCFSMELGKVGIFDEEGYYENSI